MTRLWLRLYTDTLDDKRLQQDLTGDEFRFWANLLCLSKDLELEGGIPCIEDLEFRLRVTRDIIVTSIEKLVILTLVDRDPKTKKLTLHGWNTRQYVSDTDPTALDRKRRQRQRLRDEKEVSRVTSRSSHAGSHANVTRTETETETEKRQSKKSAHVRKHDITETGEAILKMGTSHRVRLTDLEYEKFVKEHGEADTLEAVQFLDDWIVDQGDKSKAPTHRQTIDRWVWNAVIERRRKASASGHR